MKFGPGAFYFARSLNKGLKPSIVQRLLMVAMLPFLLLLIPIVGMLAFFSLRKLSRGANAQAKIFNDSDSVITVSKIEKSERLLESS